MESSETNLFAIDSLIHLCQHMEENQKFYQEVTPYTQKAIDQLQQPEAKKIMAEVALLRDTCHQTVKNLESSAEQIKLTKNQSELASINSAAEALTKVEEVIDQFEAIKIHKENQKKLDNEIRKIQKKVQKANEELERRRNATAFSRFLISAGFPILILFGFAALVLMSFPSVAFFCQTVALVGLSLIGVGIASLYFTNPQEEKAKSRAKTVKKTLLKHQNWKNFTTPQHIQLLLDSPNTERENRVRYAELIVTFAEVRGWIKEEEKEKLPSRMKSGLKEAGKTTLQQFEELQIQMREKFFDSNPSHDITNLNSVDKGLFDELKAMIIPAASPDED